MGKIKFISAILVVLLLFIVINKVKNITFVSSSNNNAGKSDVTQQLETNHFMFYSKEQDKNCLKDLSNALEKNYSKVKNDLQSSLNKKIDVYIYSDLNTYHKVINQPNAPSWVVGNADIYSDTIKMVNPVKLNGRPYSEFLKVIVHEFTHIVEHSINIDKKGIPIWLNEGVAVFEAKQDDGIEQVLSKAKSSNKFPTLKDLETDSYTFGNNGGYQFSYSIVDYIVKTYGYDKLIALIKSPSHFKKIIGISKDDFLKKWVAYINRIIVVPI